MHFHWGVLNPTARVSYFHEFEDDARIIEGGFSLTNTSNDFQLQTDAPDRDYLNVGVGLQLTLKGSKLVYVMVDTDLERDDFDQYGVTFGYRQQF